METCSWKINSFQWVLECHPKSYIHGKFYSVLDLHKFQSNLVNYIYRTSAIIFNLVFVFFFLIYEAYFIILDLFIDIRNLDIIWGILPRFHLSLLFLTVSICESESLPNSYIVYIAYWTRGLKNRGPSYIHTMGTILSSWIIS